MPSVKTLLNKTLGKADLLAGLPVHPSQLHSENIFQGAKEWKIGQSEFGLGFFFFPLLGEVVQLLCFILLPLQVSVWLLEKM